MFPTFNLQDYHLLCDQLAETDQDLASILLQYGYPPFWSRPNNFESLVHIILEQQVSLASALAALNKLKEKIGEVRPDRFLELDDDALKACYFSRQKTRYARDLAEKLVGEELNLSQLELFTDVEIRNQLLKVKGIGHWTIDIYLIFILHHTDVFPVGDLAAVNALRSLKKIPKETKQDKLLEEVAVWKPYRSIAVMMLWHYYLEERKINVKKKKV